MADENRAMFDAMHEAIRAVATLAMEDRLIALGIAWIILAQQARNEALVFPEGFPAEKTRQLTQLKNMALLVSDATPDLELEPLTQEEDWDRIVQHLKELQDDLEKGGP
jgi:hypothetical protein